jgi:hypothetical protein
MFGGLGLPQARGRQNRSRSEVNVTAVQAVLKCNVWVLGLLDLNQDA